MPLVGAVTYEVIARYVFNAPTIWAFDVTYMLYGTLFMLGAAYALHKGAHIRTDFFWEQFSTRKKGWIDSLSYVLFFFPGFSCCCSSAWTRRLCLADQRAVGPDAVAAAAVAVQGRGAAGLPAPADPGRLRAPQEPLHGPHRPRARAQGEGRDMTAEALHRADHAPGAAGRDLHRRADLVHAAVSGAAVRLFRHGRHTVFDLAYFQIIGLMKEELLAAVPLFIFMGFITEQAGLMERLFRAFRLLLAPLRGSLYLVVILTSTVFAMATGIVGAAVTVLGIMAAPIMVKAGYDAQAFGRRDHRRRHARHPDSAVGDAGGDGAGARRLGRRPLRRRVRAGLPAGRHLHRLSDGPQLPQSEARAAGADRGARALASGHAARGADRHRAAARC